MMLIYRVENEHGEGAYADSILPNMLIIQQDDENQYLDPYDDPLLSNFWKNNYYSYNWYFGFDKPEKLLAWFDSREGRKEVSYNGDGFIKVYDVPDVYGKVGLKQAIFVKHEALLVKTLDLNYFDLHPQEIEGIQL